MQEERSKMNAASLRTLVRNIYNREVVLSYKLAEHLIKYTQEIDCHLKVHCEENKRHHLEYNTLRIRGMRRC